MTHTETTLGELISVLYDEYLSLYGDPDRAALAVATSINEMLQERDSEVALAA